MVKYKFVKDSTVRQFGVRRVSLLESRQCPTCGEIFKPHTKETKYCGGECYFEMKRRRGDRVLWTDDMRKELSQRYTGRGNPMYGKDSWSKDKKRPEITGEKHPNWKGGFYISKDGYKMYSNGVLSKKTEQDLVMEKHLDRKLNRNEVVHHINENRLDNRIENLQLLTRAEHINLHRDALKKGKHGRH